MWITTIMKITISISVDVIPIVLVMIQSPNFFEEVEHDIFDEVFNNKYSPIYLIGLACHIIFEIIYLLFLLKPFYKEKGSYDTLIELNIATFFALLSILSMFFAGILYDPSEVKIDKNSYADSYEGHLFSIRSSKNSMNTSSISLDNMITMVNDHSEDS